MATWHFLWFVPNEHISHIWRGAFWCTSAALRFTQFCHIFWLYYHFKCSFSWFRYFTYSHIVISNILPLIVQPRKEANDAVYRLEGGWMDENMIFTLKGAALRNQKKFSCSTCKTRLSSPRPAIFCLPSVAVCLSINPEEDGQNAGLKMY